MLVKIIIRIEEKRFSHFHTQQFHFHTFIARQGGRGSRASESNWRPACLQIPVPGDVLPLGAEGADADADYAGGGEEDYGGDCAALCIVIVMRSSLQKSQHYQCLLF